MDVASTRSSDLGSLKARDDSASTQPVALSDDVESSHAHVHSHFENSTSLILAFLMRANLTSALLTVCVSAVILLWSRLPLAVIEDPSPDRYFRPFFIMVFFTATIVGALGVAGLMFGTMYPESSHRTLFLACAGMSVATVAVYLGMSGAQGVMRTDPYDPFIYFIGFSSSLVVFIATVVLYLRIVASDSGFDASVHVLGRSRVRRLNTYALLVHIAFLAGYPVAMIPVFRASGAVGRVLLRVIAHPCVAEAYSAIVRYFVEQLSVTVPAHRALMHFVPPVFCNLFYGRFLISTIGDATTTYVIVLVTAVLDFVLRISVSHRDRIVRSHLCSAFGGCCGWKYVVDGDGGASNGLRASLIAVWMVLEILLENTCILLVPVAVLSFYHQRHIIDLSYTPFQQPSVEVLVVSAVLQLVCEILVDIVCVKFEARSLPILLTWWKLPRFLGLRVALGVTPLVLHTIFSFALLPTVTSCRGLFESVCQCDLPLVVDELCS